MVSMPAKAALRPFLPADVPLLAEIFRSAVEDLTGDDYSPDQQAEWVASIDDLAGFERRLAAALTLVATLAGSPVGFASLEGADRLAMLYVHPAVAGRGVATLLSDAVEKLAKARGASKITVDASDTAQGFFARRSYVAQRRNTVVLGGEWLGNTTMEKALAANG